VTDPRGQQAQGTGAGSPPVNAAPVDPSLDAITQEKLYDGLLDAAAKGLERARSSGQFVQGAAAAVGTLYTGALTLVFAAKDNPLPARGLIPTLFLGGSLVLAAFYTAYLTKVGVIPQPRMPAKADDSRRLFARAAWFVGWSGAGALNRAHFLRAAVVSLAVGVFALPLPFISFSAGTQSTAQVSASASAAASAISAPTPTPIAWPTPVLQSPERLAAILYRAQLDQFKETLAKDATARKVDDSATNALALMVLLVGGGWVLRVVRERDAG
jgi:hypothetical protein